ncbi:MAG: glycosyl hydrolase [Planctomycetota bacterium]
MRADPGQGPTGRAIVSAGAGSYTTARPPGIEPLPERISRAPGLSGPTLTNQWWSSLVWQPFSRALFAHPLALHCTPGGLVIGYPGAAIHGSPAAITGGAIEPGGDLVLGLSGAAAFPEALYAGHSDWFVTARFAAGEARLDATFGHGSPFVYCASTGGDPVVRLTGGARVWSGALGQADSEGGDAVLGVTVNGHHYGLFGATGSRWSEPTRGALRNHGGAGYLSLALLPDDAPETLAAFARCAHNHVVGTRVTYAVEEGFVRARYAFELQAREGDAAIGTLFALYPHQWKYATTALGPWAYGSVRGALRVGAGDSFETRVPMQGVLPLLPREGIGARPELLAQLRAEADRCAADAQRAEWGDTYWEGKRLGRLATLSGIAEAAGERALQGVFVAELRRRLEDWFTASPAEVAPLFYYDARWGALIGNRPSYGSDKRLNDHHFHYGYFIRAAAEVARLDPKWGRKWAPMVELLIRDIASTERADPLFPRLRCFDLYAGHSWASGDADFADGNNQESSSESLNAWYGMILWGEALGDAALRDTGVFLFNTERTAIEEYWFDVSGTNFPADFPNVQLGMVWGGKGAFGTWFSGSIDCIHGINWLPFTPASLYLGRHPDYVRENHDRVIAVREDGRDYGRGWGDLLLLFHALTDPSDAVALLAQHATGNIEGGNSRAFMLHWCHTLDRLGVNDAGVTASHPLATVFVKDGVRTYAAYNSGAKALDVRFSDGGRLRVPPRSLGVSKGR